MFKMNFLVTTLNALRG